MGSGVSGRYFGTKGASEPKNGATYNTARSNKVGVVKTITNSFEHNAPTTYKPNSVYRRSGTYGLISERYYNNKGEPYLDIDYTDHGNAKRHPAVPHQHQIRYINNNFNREREGKAIIK